MIGDEDSIKRPRDTDIGSFGFEQVSFDEKTRRVRGVFNSVSGRYDLMNDLMSLGFHRWWKTYAVEILEVDTNQKVLDLAAGTADISYRLLRVGLENLEVHCNDINYDMLSKGRDRMLDKGLHSALSYIQSDGENLPYQSNFFNRSIVSFGLRNMNRKDAVLAEIFRVLAPNSKLVILDFSRVKSPIMHKLHRLYTLRVLPVLGKLVVGDSDSYKYLGESIEVHPDQDALDLMLIKAGFSGVEHYNLMGGVVAAHVGWKV